MAEAISTPARVPAQSGIYAIVNLVNGKRYIGSAVNLKARWVLHRHHLNRGTHSNRHLQSSWSKNGASIFAFRVVECCERHRLIEREQFYIDALRPEFNICSTAGAAFGNKSMLGQKHSLETRAKMSAAHLGNKNRLGIKHSEETRKKMSAASLGRKKSSEHCANIGAANRRRTLSAATRAKISASRLRYYETLRQEPTDEAPRLFAAHDQSD